MRTHYVTNHAVHSALNKAASCRAQLLSNPRMTLDKRWNLLDIAWMQLRAAARARTRRMPFPF